MTAKRKAGRPPFKPTPAQRCKVAVAAGGGMSHDAIAQVIGIDDDTLRKHFGWELSIGAYRKRFEVLEAMRKAATRGNVSAGKAYLALAPQLAGAPASPDVTEPPKPQPTVELGKKAQAQADAHVATVGTDWHDLLAGPQPGAMQ